jgi:hypothetical protein
MAYLYIIVVTFLALCDFRLVGKARWGVVLICGWRHSGGLAVFWIYRACLTTSEIGSGSAIGQIQLRGARRRQRSVTSG